MNKTPKQRCIEQCMEGTEFLFELRSFSLEMLSSADPVRQEDGEALEQILIKYNIIEGKE